MSKADQIERLKGNLRRQMNEAAARGTMTGDDVLGCLFTVGAEMVARVKDADERNQIIGSVIGFFPDAVNMERVFAERSTGRLQ